MPSTSSGSAPSSRVYRSAPRLRQRYHPPREKAVAATTRTPATIPRARKAHQSTLTQLDFATSFSREYGSEDEPAEDEVIDWEAPVAKKKRKLTRKATSDERQKTLTQMQWVSADSSDEEETRALLKGDDEVDLALSGHGDKMAGQLLRDGQADVLAGEPKSQVDLETCPAKNMPQSSHLASPSQRGAEITIFEDPSSPILGSTKRSVIATPQRETRHEVPSSQSPAASVITRSATASVSPYKNRQRSHLGEMTINELTRRDAQLQNTPSKRQKRTEPVPDSNADDGALDDDEDERFDDEAENYEPDFPLEHFKGTPVKCGSSAASSRAPSSTQSMFEPSQITGSRARYNMSPSRTPHRLSSPTLPQTPSMRTSAPSSDLNDHFTSTLGRRNRVASSPAGLLQEMADEERSSRSAEQVQSPRRTLFRHSSQATTVDITQPSPQMRAPPSSNSMGPPRGVSQFPESGHSLDGLDDWSRMSNMSAFNSSAPLRTVSQLLGPSQSDDDDFFDVKE